MTRPTLLVYTGEKPDRARPVCSRALKKGWLPIGPETRPPATAGPDGAAPASGEAMIMGLVSLLSRADALLLPVCCLEPERNGIAATLDMEAGYRGVPVYRYRTGDDLPKAPDGPASRPTTRETLRQVTALSGRKCELFLAISRRVGSTKDELREATGIPVSTIRATLRRLEQEHLIFRAAYGSAPGTPERRIFLTRRGEDVADILPLAGVLRGTDL